MIGQTLEAAGLPRVKVVGQQGMTWVVEPLDASFGAPYALTEDEVFAYLAPAPTPVDEARAWVAMGRQ